MSLVLIEHRIGETRAAHFDALGVPVRVFLERRSEADTRAWRGRPLTGIVRSRGFDPGGQFVELDTGESALMRLPRKETIPPQGLKLDLVVEAEAQNGKAARVRRPSAGEPVCDTAFEAWAASLKPPHEDVRTVESEEDRALLDLAFEEALLRTSLLPGGGYISVAPAGTLTAIDVDAAGRAAHSRDKWTSGKWARELNLEAAVAAARRLVVSEGAGLIVLDCVGQMKGGAGAMIKTAFETEFSRLSRRQAVVLAPSKLGLMEVSLQRAFQPLAERFGSVEARALAALDRLEREARAQAGATLRLSVPRGEHDWLSRPPFDWQAALGERIGRRFALDPDPSDTVKVSAT